MENKNLDQQCDIFEQRGIIIDDRNQAKNKLKYINYYKIKEYAYPFSSINEYNEIKYDNVNFEKIINRYFQDSRMRVNMMECIEIIEIAFKTVLARELGKNSAFEYLKFNNWCNKSEYCKHYLEEKQGDLKNLIKNKKSNSKLLTREIEIYLKREKSKKDGSDKIPVWMVVEIFTFGEISYLLKLMSQNRISNIAVEFDSSISELLSWTGLLNFIRNQVAHNHNIIDLKLKSKPKIKNDWEKYLYTNCKGEVVTNRLSIIIIVIVYLVRKINPKYKFNKFQRNINSLIKNDKDACYYGFKNLDTAKNIIKLLGGEFNKNNKKYVNKNSINKYLKNCSIDELKYFIKIVDKNMNKYNLK